MPFKTRKSRATLAATVMFTIIIGLLEALMYQSGGWKEVWQGALVIAGLAIFMWIWAHVLWWVDAGADDV
jgi:hypothetical protein